MQKDPAFPFYAQDFLMGTMYMDFSDLGRYIKLLAYQWDNGNIPKKRLGLLVGYSWESFSEDLAEKFAQDENYIWNNRLELEREKRAQFKEKQAINGSKGGRPKPKDNPDETQTLPKIKPLENEYENEEEDENKEENKIEKAKTQFSEMLKDFEADYKSEMLLDFFEYWTEPNKSKTKCRYELEKTWDTARRLATWAKNQKQFSPSETISESTHALKPIWDEFYYQKTGLKYYFDSLSMKILNQIENQLQFTIREGGSGSTTPIAFKFMLDNIKDKWVLDNLSLKIIASKYNEIISKIKKPTQNGKPSLEDNLAELNAIINEMYPDQ